VVLLDEHPSDGLRRNVKDAVTYCPAMALSIEETDE
jgi:ferredoxin